jgi:hypothetical protein
MATAIAPGKICRRLFQNRFNEKLPTLSEMIRIASSYNVALIKCPTFLFGGEMKAKLPFL